MKLIIICALATVALAYGPDGNHEKSNRVAEIRNRNPYEHLLRSERSIQTCTPGTMRKIDCNDCICPKSGSGWLCTLKGCVQTTPSQEIADSPITSPDQVKQLVRSKRDMGMKGECDKEGDVRQVGCYTCYCDSEKIYSNCVSVAQCDLENPDAPIIQTINAGRDFNLEVYEIISDPAN